MAIVRSLQPPNTGESYIIPQLEGERITIPGSKGVFRILASARQTNSKIAVFTSGAVLSDAPGFHYHNEAHDVFLVTKGFLKLWNGDQCRIMGPGDFAYVPPKVVHNPEQLGPHTETYGLVAPGDWVDFFRYVSEPFSGLIAPETNNRDLVGTLMPKIMAAKDRFDVVFQRDYKPPELSDWKQNENQLPRKSEPYFSKSNTGPRWMTGGVLSRPFITTKQTNGKFAISSIESSHVYGETILSRSMTFENVDHCLCVVEGTLIVGIEEGEKSRVTEGETALIPQGKSFTLEFGSRFVRIWSFSSGDGIEALIQKADSAFSGFVLPDEPPKLEEDRVLEVCKDLGIKLEAVI